MQASERDKSVALSDCAAARRWPLPGCLKRAFGRSQFLLSVRITHSAARSMASPARPGPAEGWPGPASPDELEAARKYNKKQRRRARPPTPRELRLLGSTLAWVSGGVLAGLLVIGAVRRVHDRFLAPKVQALVEQARQQGLEAADQQRRGVLLERYVSGPAGRWAPGEHASPTIPQGSAANCSGVSLAAADRQLLRREIGSIVRSLSGPHPWLLGLPEAQEGGGTGGDQAGGSAALSKGQVLSVPGVQARRVVDEPFGPQPSSNIPGAPLCRLAACSRTRRQARANAPGCAASPRAGVEDVHAELAAYAQAMVDAMVLDAQAAAKRQHRATAAELGLQPLDDLGDVASLPLRIAYLNELMDEVAVLGRGGGPLWWWERLEGTALVVPTGMCAARRLSAGRRDCVPSL